MSLTPPVDVITAALPEEPSTLADVEGGRSPAPAETSASRGEDPAEPLCWLHLSDLHIGTKDWQLDTVLQALKRDLPGLLAHAARKPQLLFVTGDVAKRAREVEYDAAFRFLDELCQLLELGRERVFLVPGNHDVDRDAISKPMRRSEKSLIESLDRN